MLSSILKYGSLSALLLVIALGRLAPEYQPYPQLAIFIGSGIVAIQTLQEKRYGWMAGFLAIVILFNPILIVANSPDRLFLFALPACILTVARVLAMLQQFESPVKAV